MKPTLYSLLLSLSPFAVAAQNTFVTGTVVTASPSSPLEYATAALLANGVVVKTATTDAHGRFSFSAPSGAYALRVSYIGARTFTKELQVQGDTLRLDTLALENTEATLAEAIIAASVSKMQQVGDTTQFNAAAYRVPAGSTLEALLKQLPGVTIAENGTVTWNGKVVNEFLINGKDLFKGDTKVALKNIPTELVSKVKAYDRKSDYTEMTGIDDGEETIVMDFSTKRSLDNTWTITLDAAGGNKSRYANRLFAARFTPQSSFTLYGQMNNNNSQSMGSPLGSEAEEGLTTHKGAGFNYAWDNGKKRRRPGYVATQVDFRYGHTNNDLVSRTSTEHFLASGNTFMESLAYNRSSVSNLQTAGHLEWQADSTTFLSLRPSFSYGREAERGNTQSAIFHHSPFALSGIDTDQLYEDPSSAALDALTVNRKKLLTQSKNTTYRGGLSLFGMHRLNSAGRHIGFRGRVSFNHSEEEGFAFAHIRFLQSGKQSLTHQYATEPSKSWDYNLRMSYAEPLGRNWFAEVAYQYEYRYSHNDLNQYDLDTYAAWHQLSHFGIVPSTTDSLIAARDDENSKYATYRTYTHRPSIGLRYNAEKFRISASVELNPQRTTLDYTRPELLDTTITREVLYFSPRLRLRYQFDDDTRLQVSYRGRAVQPSMTNLLNVVDSDDPLNASVGNAGLKPAWNNRFRAEFETSRTEPYQENLSAGLEAQQTWNAVSNRTLYDATTGARYVRPENISGNWEASGNFLYNRALGAAQRFNVSTHTSAQFTNHVGYISTASAAIRPEQVNATDLTALFLSEPATKNATRTFSIDEDLTLTYRQSWFDVALKGTVGYHHGRANRLNTSSLNAWNFSYGASTNVELPWGMSLSTELLMSSRRGYSSAAMNTNEFLWNAQLSQSLLKGAATVSLQVYDLLGQQSNLSRVLNATKRSDTWTNAINSYFLVSFVYKLNILGGKGSTARKAEHSNKASMPPPHGTPGRGGGWGHGMPPH